MTCVSGSLALRLIPSSCRCKCWARPWAVVINAVLMAGPALRIDTSWSRWLQRRAPQHRWSAIVPSAWVGGSRVPDEYRQARASGQPRVATARRSLRSVSAVACCSSNGRGCGRTIAGRRAAATSATQLFGVGDHDVGGADVGRWVGSSRTAPQTQCLPSDLGYRCRSCVNRRAQRNRSTSKWLSRDRNDTDDGTGVPSLR